MSQQEPVVTILGSGGGVAKSILAILDKAFRDPHDPIHSWIQSCHLHLIDKNLKSMKYYEPYIPHLQHKVTLHQLDLSNLDLFKKHLVATKTRIVIDVSWADTVEMLQCCHDCGVHYVNTAL
jgi:homospermidine synthase